MHDNIDRLIDDAKKRGDFIRAGYLTEQKKQMEKNEKENEPFDFLKEILNLNKRGDK